MGGLNTVIGYGLFMAFLFFGLQYLLANTIAYILGIIHSYLWNKYFTFNSKNRSFREAFRFVSVYLISYFIGMATLFLFVSILKINEYIAGGINIISTTVISWYGHNYYSFKIKVNGRV